MNQSSENREGQNDWQLVPTEFHYLRPWADRFGLRGLTVHFGDQPPLSKLASPSELVELRQAYEVLAERDDALAISQWCWSIPAQTPAVEVREAIRGLLLLFERLSDRGLEPFTDGRVRYVYPEPREFDWSVLPPHLKEWQPWLEKFENLRTEGELYDYLVDASDEQLDELAELKQLFERDRTALAAWCEANNVTGNPVENEAFQAEWIFLLMDFAREVLKNR